MKKILVVIDTQNDFIDGSLKNEEAIKVVPNIVKKINEFDGSYIFVTRDTHSDDYLNTPEGKKLPIIHCLENTNGWFINSSISKALHSKEFKDDGCVVTYINKPTFGSLKLIDTISNVIVNDSDIDIELIGFCTDICVVSNALLLKTNFYDRANISVDSSCCAGVTPESHEAALTTMRMCQIDIK